MHLLNAHNLKNNCSLLESTQYGSPSSMPHYTENNSVMKNATSYSLSLYFWRFPSLLLATLLAHSHPTDSSWTIPNQI